MKTLYFFLIPLIILFAGCKKHINDEITIIGHLKDVDIKEIFLSSDNLTFKTPVNSNGNFMLKFVSNQSRIYQLKSNDELNLFLIPGDSIIINKDGGDYKFSGGQSALISQYYLDWGKNYWNGDSFNEKRFYSLEPEEFTKTAYAYLDTSQILFNKLIKKLKNINPEFVHLEKERLKYDMFGYIQAYGYEMHKYHTGKEPTINESFYNYMKDVNLNDSSLMQLEYYRKFLSNYIYYTSVKKFQSNPEIPKDKYTLTSIMLNSISRELKNQRIRDYVTHDLIIDQTKLLEVDNNNLVLYKELCNNQDYLKEVENIYNELKGLMPGNIAPDFTLYDANNKEYKLSDFKGKYLFIDVWGAFCGPCKKDAPYLNQIENDYKGKNIEFIGVCFEKNLETWLQRIKEYNLGGIQLTAKEDWNSQFRKDYKIPWVPIYILIDKEGKFIDARAPKPSENLRDLLDKTLENKK
jgi:thiol-disulfide isomerase/thioredoxin